MTGASQDIAAVAAGLSAAQRAALLLIGTDYSRPDAASLIRDAHPAPQAEFKALDGILWTKPPRELTDLGYAVRDHLIESDL